MDAPLSIVEASAAMRAGTLTPLELVGDCLERIGALEPKITAWVAVDAEGALEAAEGLSEELAARKCRSVLHGIPIAIKDIFDVAGMPTRAGSTITDPGPVAEDAPIVALLRRAGAVILGKTVTTEFASFDPPPTKNPWNAACTPGGSSSGSAAATALGMCTAAIGSQTGGSITRPASYCGVAGIKPTFGRVSRRGVVPLAFHLDHVGPMARTIADCAIILHTIAGPDARDPASSMRPNFERPDVEGRPPVRPPRLGVIRKYFFETADPETAALTEAALEKLQAAGATLVELPLPDYFDPVRAMHRRIMAGEAADYHRATYGAPRLGYSPQVAALLDEGFAMSVAEYQEALRHQLAFRNAMERTLAEVDAAVIPSTVSPAPADLTTTGDPRFNSPWSHAGIPTASLPCSLSKAGLPVSLQLLSPAWSETSLVQTAMWCEGKLGFRAMPALIA